MRRVVVTGANRGLGLEFTRQLLARGDRVYAAVRKPGHALDLTKLALAHPGRVSVLPFDATKPATAVELVREIGLVDDAIDVLINNAGVLPPGERYGAIEAKALIDAYTINVVGATLLTQAATPMLERGTTPRVVNISSILGSIGTRAAFGTPSYAISKAALNMATRQLAFELSARGIVAVAIHPGWVRTAMGGAEAELEPAAAVASVLGVIDRLRGADAGRFLDWNGTEVPW
jgi:NAD(P)-dependent dehydrogenase (short-subunit alcohol dehydrogenase family)